MLGKNWTELVLDGRHLEENKNCQLMCLPGSASQMFQLHPLKTVMVHKLYDSDCEARLNSVNRYVTGCTVGKSTLHSFCLTMNLGFKSVYT